MSRSITPEVVERTLKGITIPTRPQVLVKIQNELKKDDPDPRAVGRLIAGDVGLCAAVLKTVNSPFFRHYGAATPLVRRAWRRRHPCSFWRAHSVSL